MIKNYEWGRGQDITYTYLHREPRLYLVAANKKARSCERALLACQDAGLSFGCGSLLFLFRRGCFGRGFGFHRHVNPFKDCQLRGVALALV
jgi:hypothetical protein